MAENYCGKDCTQCSYRADLACPGCKAGPGRKFGGDCELAKCCMERGHDTCATCNQQSWCGKCRDSETMADIRLQKQQREKAKRAQLEKQVPLLAKCLTLIFWLTIVGFIPAAMSNDLTIAMPGLHQTGKVLNLVLSLVIAVAYTSMGVANNRYRKAALCMGVSVIVSSLLTWITGGETPPWTLLITLPVAVLGFVGKYNLYTAHSEVLAPVDYDLSEKWMKLWKWYIGLFSAMIAGTLLTVILPVLGLLAVLVTAIGTVVISVMETIYLFRIGKLFRAYAQSLAV